MREHLRRGRGRSLRRTVNELRPLFRGWIQYFRLAETKNTFEDLDQWIRRRLRCLLWRQWKRPRTRAKKLRSRGIPRETAFRSAYNGRGPLWNARTPHMHQAVPARYLHEQGLMSLLQEHRRLARPIRTAVYGTVHTVV